MPVPPKKAAKKAAKKAPGHHSPSRDARRTFEHLGRVQAIAALADSESESLAFLTKSADLAFRSQLYKHSADLLRAAEHLSFASINRTSTGPVSEFIRLAIVEEFDHLLMRAEEHASHHDGPESINELRRRMTRDAKAAMRLNYHRAALEFARGAEALAHIDELEGLILPSLPKQKRLRG